MKKLLLLAIIVFLVLIQFRRIDKVNPPIDESLDFVEIYQPPDEIASILKNSCYDCHGNTTEYPWYTNIAPVSWWIKGHIDNARKRVNYSEWGKYTEKERSNHLTEIAEVLLEKRMPAATYMIMHSNAKVNDDQRKLVADWAKGINP